MEERELLARLSAGEPEAMERLLARYGGMMGYIVRGILSDPQEAEECLAQVRTKLWEKLPDYREERAALATWITAVCRNAAYDRLRELGRRRERTAELDENCPDPAPGPEELVLRRERRERLRQALAALGTGDRRLFYRKYYYLQSTAQIAAELGLSQRAVEGRLYRIRKQLQKRLGGDAL